KRLRSIAIVLPIPNYIRFAFSQAFSERKSRGALVRSGTDSRMCPTLRAAASQHPRNGQTRQTSGALLGETACDRCGYRGRSRGALTNGQHLVVLAGETDKDAVALAIDAENAELGLGVEIRASLLEVEGIGAVADLLFVEPPLVAQAQFAGGERRAIVEARERGHAVGIEPDHHAAAT